MRPWVISVVLVLVGGCRLGQAAALATVSIDDGRIEGPTLDGDGAVGDPDGEPVDTDVDDPVDVGGGIAGDDVRDDIDDIDGMGGTVAGTIDGVSGPDPGIAAQVSGCDARASDNGHVVHVVVERDCELAPGPVTVELMPSDADVVAVPLERGRPISTVVPGLGSRRVGLHRQGDWVSFPNEGTWAPRDGAGLLELDGALYLLGGWLHGPTCSEVWRTTDLETWEFLGDAPWPARHGAAWLVHDDRLWVIGGDLLDDVWSSPDGVVWHEETASAPFGRRYTPNAAVLGGEIVVYAGQGWGPVDWCHERPDCYATGFQDVWASPDGQHWRQLTPEAPWGPRGLIHGSVVVDGELHLIGGGLKAAPPDARYMETVVDYDDVWTTSDGITWVERDATVPPRTHFSVVTTPMGCFMSDGSVGTQFNVTNDLFHATDCRHFEPVVDALPLQARHASSMVWFNGALVILGGPQGGGAGTMVWQYFP